MSSISNSGIVRLHGHYTRACRLLQSPLLLLIRLYWGWQFAETGWGKLHHIHRVVGFFGSLGIPHPGLVAPFVSATEFVGGILLILGLVSRLTALVLAIDMFVAYWVGDPAALHSILSDPGKFWNADPYTFLFASLIVLVFGPGLFSLDALLGLHETKGQR
jgi:putative oxidoreductase